MQIDELCTTVRALCNIVALIERADRRQMCSVTLPSVQCAHVFDAALHAEGLRMPQASALHGSALSRCSGCTSDDDGSMTSTRSARPRAGRLLLDGAMATYVHASAGGASPASPRATRSRCRSRRSCARRARRVSRRGRRHRAHQHVSRRVARARRTTRRDLCAGGRAARPRRRRRVVAAHAGAPALRGGRPRSGRARAEPAGSTRDGRTSSRRCFARRCSVCSTAASISLLLRNLLVPGADRRGAAPPFADAMADAGRRVPVPRVDGARRRGRVAVSGVSLDDLLAAIDPAAVDGARRQLRSGPGRAARRRLPRSAATIALVSCHPSAGLPAGDALTPAAFAQTSRPTRRPASPTSPAAAAARRRRTSAPWPRRSRRRARTRPRAKRRCDPRARRDTMNGGARHHAAWLPRRSIGIPDQAISPRERRPRNPVHRGVLRRIPAQEDRARRSWSAWPSGNSSS